MVWSTLCASLCFNILILFFLYLYFSISISFNTIWSGFLSLGITKENFHWLQQVLAVSRIMVAWQPIGISMGVFDICHRYQSIRKIFKVCSLQIMYLHMYLNILVKSEYSFMPCKNLIRCMDIYTCESPKTILSFSPILFQ